MKFTEEQSSKAAMTAYRCNNTLNSMAVERERAADLVRVEGATRAILPHTAASAFACACWRARPTNLLGDRARAFRHVSVKADPWAPTTTVDGWKWGGRRSERAHGRGDKKELGGGAVFIYSRTVSSLPPPGPENLLETRVGATASARALVCLPSRSGVPQSCPVATL
jgi:hypothetical protein